jgi:hypothetical protein
VPGVIVAGHYAVTAWRNRQRLLTWVYAGGTAAVLAVFACWPGSWLHTPKNAPYQFGLIWLPPQSSPFGPTGFYAKGDQASFHEYHWRGLQLVTGNAYVLAGLAVFAVLFFEQDGAGAELAELADYPGSIGVRKVISPSMLAPAVDFPVISLNGRGSR